MKNFDPDFNNTEKLANLFGDEAKRVANLLNDGSGYKADISTTQFRQFYEKILELNDKAEGNDKFNVEVLPFVKLLNSKVQYSHSRRHCGDRFVEMMEKSIKNVNSAEELKNFKYFLEAIIGYMPKK
ncbi:MAG: type III-A CRISPR-associated protein Csm2 [Epsilonproteobacteria bacterium]|nr:type III-A CRISPR-associated protein Csm2 [Campylobacterota bacterium]MBD3807219.1 type III-A CRISPR-associated protein Csm2 [Campylobacterota bacterium]